MIVRVLLRASIAPPSPSPAVPDAAMPPLARLTLKFEPLKLACESFRKMAPPCPDPPAKPFTPLPPAAWLLVKESPFPVSTDDCSASIAPPAP